MRVRGIALLLCGVFIVLGFLTWQQITVFRLGYRISELSQEMVVAEIHNQELMEEARDKLTLTVICRRSRAELRMKVPGTSEKDLIKVEGVSSPGREGRIDRVVAYFRELFSPSQAQAR